MQWITPNLAIGSAYYDSDKRELDAQGISAVLQLYEGYESWPAHWQALHLPIADGQPVSCETVRVGREFVQAQRAAGHKTLVCCLMGQSRSSTFAFACLLADGHTPQAAWRILKTRHPNAYPHPILLQSVLHCLQVRLTVAELYTLSLNDTTA
jgi:protein-tyrosine phosphatase